MPKPNEWCKRLRWTHKRFNRFISSQIVHKITNYFRNNNSLHHYFIQLSPTDDITQWFAKYKRALRSNHKYRWSPVTVPGDRRIQRHCKLLTDNKRRSPEDIASSGLLLKKVAASYSPALHCSTIGASGLNFSVRNGKRWDPAAITTW